MSLNTVNILGIKINSSSASSVLKEIIEFASTQGQPKLIFTPNPEFLVEANRDLEFREILNKADINLPDGVGLVLASRILGQPIKERTIGADVVEKLLEAGNKKKWEVGSGKWAIGIAGARRGVTAEAEELIKKLEIKYPNLKFVNLDDPELSIINDQLSNKNQNPNFRKYLKIENCELKIVFACHGMGEQEKWIMENKDKIKASVFMGVGSSLDYLTGFSQRSPRWMRKVGLEWFWRGLQKPGHFKRIWRAVVEFGWLVIKEKLANR